MMRSGTVVRSCGASDAGALLRRRLRDLALLAIAIAGVACFGCTRYVAVDPARGPQAYYQMGFPTQDMSVQLERILASVVRIQVDASYDRYFFPADDAVTTGGAAIQRADLVSRAVDTVLWRRSASATAVVIAASSERLTLVSTDHAIDFPDTIVAYFGSPELSGAAEPDARAIESIAIRTRLRYTVVGPSYIEPFEVVARRATDDLALLGVALPPEESTASIPVRPPPPRNPALDLARADPSMISWGSFIYMVGYPTGQRMVTRGIVSQPDRRNSSFLIDGLWNEGMSGAPILAVRGDGSGLEWVAIARAASARAEHRLVTNEGAERTQDPRLPYEGPVFLREAREIRYGISFSTSVTLVRRFLAEESARLTELGYPVPVL